METSGSEPGQCKPFHVLFSEEMKTGSGRNGNASGRPWEPKDISKIADVGEKQIRNYANGSGIPPRTRLHVLLEKVFCLIDEEGIGRDRHRHERAMALRRSAFPDDDWEVRYRFTEQQPLGQAPAAHDDRRSEAPAAKARQSGPVPESAGVPGLGNVRMPTASPTFDFYLSSTWSDLNPELEKIKSFLGEVGLTFWQSRSASPAAPMQSCLDDIDRCKAYLLVLGMRYGEPAAAEVGGDGIRSCTEHEFDHATQRKAGGIFVFRKKDDLNMPFKDRDTDTSRVLAFRSKASQAQRNAEFDSIDTLQSALNRSRADMVLTVGRAVASGEPSPTGAPIPFFAPEPGFPKYPPNVDQRLTAVGEALAATSAKDNAARRRGPAAALIGDWLASAMIPPWNLQTDVLKLFSLLTYRIEQASKHRAWAGAHSATIEDDKSMLLNIAKHLFVLAWTEQAFATFIAAPVLAHPIEYDDLLHAGQSAALGLDFDLPHSPDQTHWRLDLGGEIQPGVLDDKGGCTLDWVAQQLGMKPRPPEQSRFSSWSVDVVAKVKVRQRRFGRALVLAAKLEPDRQALVDEVYTMGRSLNLMAQVRTGTGGDYFRPQVASEAELRSEIEDCLKAIDNIAST